jgi:hypothetical protein
MAEAIAEGLFDPLPTPGVDQGVVLEARVEGDKVILADGGDAK